MYKECLSAMSFEFRSEEMVSRTDVPAYQAWLDTADFRPPTAPTAGSSRYCSGGCPPAGGCSNRRPTSRACPL